MQKSDTQKTPGKTGRLNELLSGFEPLTSSLPRMRTTDCAIAANLIMEAKAKRLLFQKLLSGFEPLTSSLPRMRTTDCAIAAYWLSR